MNIVEWLVSTPAVRLFLGSALSVSFGLLVEQWSPMWCRGHQVARKDEVGRPRTCSKNNISMINVLPLTNINTKIIKSKLSKIFISEVCIKLVVLHINRYTRSSSQFQ